MDKHCSRGQFQEVKMKRKKREEEGERKRREEEVKCQLMEA